MSWAWWSDDLGLHAFTPSSTFISNLHFLSVVLPCSCSLRERGRWEMGEWVELVLLQLRYGSSNFRHMTSGCKGWVEDSSLPTHYMHFRRWRMVQYYVGQSGILWDLALGQLTLFQRSTTWSPIILTIMLHLFRLWVASLVGSNIFVVLVASKSLQGSSKSCIGDRNWEPRL